MELVPDLSIGLWNTWIIVVIALAASFLPFMFGGELSEVHKDSLESLGAYVLGSDHVIAMERMESIIPAFSKK